MAAGKRTEPRKSHDKVYRMALTRNHSFIYYGTALARKLSEPQRSLYETKQQLELSPLGMFGVI